MTITLTATLGSTSVTVTGISLTALTRSDNDATPSGVTLPAAFVNTIGVTWAYTFTDPDGDAPDYAYSYTITLSNGQAFSGGDTVPAVQTQVGYWTTQAAIELAYGTINTGADVDVNSDGSDVAEIWDDAIAEVDSIWTREVKRHGYALPADPQDADIDTDALSDGEVHPNFSNDYAVLSNLARDWARVRLYYVRGWGDTGSPQDVAGKFAKLQAYTWQRFLQVLGEGIDFPQDATADDFSVTAPVGLRLTMDKDGRAMTGSGIYPAWNPMTGRYE